MNEARVTSAEAAARITHDLGLAACFGGTLFGKVVFNGSLPAIASKTQRGRLGAAFWNRANPVNGVAFGLALATYLPGRLGRSYGEADGGSRGLLLAKDILAGAAGAAGLAAVLAQISLNRRAPEGAVPLESGGVPAPEAGETTALIQRAVGALGGVNVALFAGLVAVTAMLSESGGAARCRFRANRSVATTKVCRIEGLVALVFGGLFRGIFSESSRCRLRRATSTVRWVVQGGHLTYLGRFVSAYPGLFGDRTHVRRDPQVKVQRVSVAQVVGHLGRHPPE